MPGWLLGLGRLEAALGCSGQQQERASVNLLVKRHGEDAPIEAAMLKRVELDGYAVWKRILHAVRELDGTAPGPGAARMGGPI